MSTKIHIKRIHTQRTLEFKSIITTKRNNELTPNRRNNEIAPYRTPVIVDGVRIPFALANTTYKDLMAVDLGTLALDGLVKKTGISTMEIDYILLGTVIQEAKTANIAREAALGANIPNCVPSHTMTMACISANAAICQAAEKIMAGTAETIVVGGCETFSDLPIRFSKPIRHKLLRGQKVFKQGIRSTLPYMLNGLAMKDLVPETPSIANYTTGEVMGHSSDRLSAKFGVSRQEQDEFAVRSHTLAAAAHDEGLYNDEIVPYNGTYFENGIKRDTNMNKLQSLKPSFVKKNGTHTAANSSFLTDGATSCLIMSEERALSMGFTPKAYLRNWSFSAVDPFEELLLGPTYAINDILEKSNMKLGDIGVVEFHEAFAGQVLSNLTAIGSNKFGEENLGRRDKIGDIQMDTLNTQGGSLSLGHPFGATGARILTTAANRLIREDKQFALLAACADGGLGHAAIIERYPA